MSWWSGQPAAGSKAISRYVRENFEYLKTICDNIGDWYDEISTHFPITAGAATGVNLCSVRILIMDGTNPNTIKFQQLSRNNGDIINSIDNISKGSTVSGVSLSAAGDVITIGSSRFSKLVNAVVFIFTVLDSCGIPFYIEPSVVAGNVSLVFTDDSGAGRDLTGMIDGTDQLILYMSYIATE